MNSNQTLSKSAQAVQHALAKKGFQLNVVELAASTGTAQEAADALGCTVEQIVKSLIFCTKDAKKPILVLASGVNRVNEKQLEALIGEKISKADADFVREVTGFAIGGVSPVGHTQTLQTYIDQDLLQYDVLWAAAGTPHAVFSLSPQDLVRLCDGHIAAIV